MDERTLDGRYLLRREILKSRRCFVYQAQHRYTQRVVALKLLRRSIAVRTEERDMLLGEARWLSEIRHACVPEVLDAGEIDDLGVPTPYVVMEMIEGRTLAGLLAARRRLETPAAVALAQALCAALRAVHASGMAHLDVTPRNIMLPTARADRQLETRGSPIKLMGFSEAVRKLLGDDKLREGDDEYRSPEQLRGETMDVRADVFAVGAVVYESLAGMLPYTGPAPARFTATRSLGDLVPDVPRALADVVARALALDPGDRPQTMDALMGELGRALQTVPPAGSLVPPSPRPVSAPPVSAPTKRRKHPRAAYLTPVHVMREDGSTIDASSEDISVGGMLLFGAPQGEGNRAPELDSDQEGVQVRFALPVSGRVVTVTATTRWRQQARDGAGAAGLQFEDLDEKAREEIATYVEYFAEA